MEAVIAVLRPKYFGSVSRDFDPKAYDLLLIDGSTHASENAGANKKFPKTTISFELEPADALFTYLYNLSGAELGGLKGWLLQLCFAMFKYLHFCKQMSLST